MQGREHRSICHIPSLHEVSRTLMPYPHADANHAVQYAHVIYQFGCQHVGKRN